MARPTKETRTNNWKREIQIDDILFDSYGKIHSLLFCLAKQILLKIYIHRTWTHINLHVSFMFSPLITLYILSRTACADCTNQIVRFVCRLRTTAHSEAHRECLDIFINLCVSRCVNSFNSEKFRYQQISTNEKGRKKKLLCTLGWYGR